MSGYAWMGVVGSAVLSTLAIISYAVMALPYLEDAPYMQELRKQSSRMALVILAVFGVLMSMYYAAAQVVTQQTSGPLLIFSAVVLCLPFSLLIGTETWDRHNGHGMNQVPGPRAIAVATGIGLAELVGVLAAFFVMFQIG